MKKNTAFQPVLKFHTDCMVLFSIATVFGHMGVLNNRMCDLFPHKPQGYDSVRVRGDTCGKELEMF